MGLVVINTIASDTSLFNREQPSKLMYKKMSLIKEGKIFYITEEGDYI